MRRLPLGIFGISVALSAMCFTAHADELHLRNGRTVDGTLVEETGGFVVFRTASGAEARFAAKDVLKIVKGESPAEAFKTRFEALPAGDLRAHKQLVAFCTEKKLRKQARKVRELIVQRFPDDAETRRALNHVKHEGKWMPRSEYMKSLGLVKDGKSWVTADVAAAREKARVAKSKRNEVERVIRRAATRDAAYVRGLLAKYDNQTAAPVLASFCDSPSPRVRRFAIEELGLRKAREAELALARAAVKDTKSSLRKAALNSLGELGELEKAPQYFLRSVTREKTNQFKRVNAIKAVGAYPTKGNGAVPVLIRALRETTGNFGKANISVTTQRAYIQDYELSSGGTGNIVAEVADPIIGTFTEGVTLEMKVTLWERRVTVDVLSNMTGQSFGYDADKWQRWWDGQK